MENRAQALLGVFVVAVTVSAVALVPFTPSPSPPANNDLNPGPETSAAEPAVPRACGPPLDNVTGAAAVVEFLNLSENSSSRLSWDCLLAVSTPGWSHDFVGAYEDLQDRGLPLLITSDAVLHAFHIVFDGLLKDLETDVFRPDLIQLSIAMMEGSMEAADAVDPALRSVALRNAAFFGVPLRLLDPNATLREEVQALVEAEIANIDEHTGMAPSPIFNSAPAPMEPVKEDYSQYVPRGHYTETPALESYFRAMMWFGRMSFHVDSDAELQGAALIGDLWSQLPASVHQRWERVYNVTSFLIGPSDDLMPSQIAAILEQALGDLGSNASALLDAGNLMLIRQAAESMARPQIVSELVFDLDPDNPEPIPAGLRFMGQRFVVDSAVFQQLVFDRVTDYQGDGTPFTAVDLGNKLVRGFPRALDVMSALGSDVAATILESEGDADYTGYDKQAGVARSLFANLTDEQWNSTAYLRWLRALQAGLAMFNSSDYPEFMRGEAYSHQKLNTAMGSWTALRRDTILYAKQSYTTMPTGIVVPEEPPAVYVEPVTGLYERLAELVAATSDGLLAWDTLPLNWENRLAHMGYMLENLTTISRTELAGEPLSADQLSYGRYFADRLDGMLGTIDARSRDSRLVADVHTDPNTRQVLEEATGELSLMAVLVQDADDEWFVVVGPIFSHYEFKQPMSDRLTDEAWRAMTASGDTPAMAPWVSRFLEA